MKFFSDNVDQSMSLKVGNNGMNQSFFRLISDYLAGIKSSSVSIPSNLNALAQSHQIAPIIYYQTNDQKLKSAYLQAISVYTQRKALLKQITEALSEIPFYIVKGITVAQYYPNPQLRTMGDCDIIVHEEEKEKARQLLLSIGFTDHTGEWNTEEWHLKKSGLDFELHHRLLYDETVNTKVEKAFTDTAWDYVQDHELDVNFHFVFLLLHLKKHLLNRGVGLRQFMDLSVMSLNARLDYERVSTFLRQAGIEKFAGVCSALCLRWFGISLPVETPEITDEFYEKTTETILANGVFGFGLPRDERKILLNSIKQSGKLGAIARLYFPSYEDCTDTPKYKWIKGKPYLMPALWIYRIFWALFSGKSKSSVEYMSAVAKSDKAISDRNEELAAWGL